MLLCFSWVGLLRRVRVFSSEGSGTFYVAVTTTPVTPEFLPGSSTVVFDPLLFSFVVFSLALSLAPSGDVSPDSTDSPGGAVFLNTGVFADVLGVSTVGPLA